MLCLWCGLLIEDPRKNQKYHPTCYKDYRREYKRNAELQRRKKNKLPKICVQCGKEWIPEHGNIKFCSVSCKADFKARQQGFKSVHEKKSLKRRVCPECGARLVQDHYRDAQVCIMCGFSKRTIPKVRVDNKKTYPKIDFTVGPGEPFCLEFHHLRGKNQEQHLMDHSDSGHYVRTNFENIDSLFCKCGMLKGRCRCPEDEAEDISVHEIQAM